MSRKKSSLAVLLVGLALALGSCSLGQAPEQSISFATTAGNRQVMESIISQFEAANPGITVDAEFDSSDQYAAALQDGLLLARLRRVHADSGSRDAAVDGNARRGRAPLTSPAQSGRIDCRPGWAN